MTVRDLDGVIAEAQRMQTAHPKQAVHPYSESGRRIVSVFCVCSALGAVAQSAGFRKPFLAIEPALDPRVWQSMRTKNDTSGAGDLAVRMTKGFARATIFDSGEVGMASRQVILYFDDQKDALRFALAAGSVMSSAGEITDEQRNLIQETQRASRILLDEPVNTGAASEPAR
jgi:hypothetical protein